MEVKDKNKKIIVITLLLITFIGVTLAYVIAQISGGAIGNANVTADTTDNLKFSVDKDINLNPTQFNVTEGGGGLSDTATGAATLLANSTNSTATYTYYVYFNIKSNDYIYTTEDQKPEIVLTITDPNNNPVTSVDGLTYVNAENADGTTVSGFDITTKSGLFNVASNYEITSSSSTNATVQDWTFTVTFINLTTNQSANGGSTLDAKIILSHDIVNFHDLCDTETIACHIAKLYDEENPEINGLYYHDGMGAYGSLEAEDNSYRFAGNNDVVKNYVCFGSEEEICPEDNLYRIIGIFNGELKLIKNSYDYRQWDINNLNNWSNSSLKEELNGTYLESLSDYSNMIDKDAIWYLGDDIWITATAKEFYNAERSTNVYAGNPTTDVGAIGLMYPSDFGYAASPENWNKGLGYYENTSSNQSWIYNSEAEWTIMPGSSDPNGAFHTTENYSFSGNGANYWAIARPCLYLNYEVKYVSGTGTSTDPYRIA